MLILNLEHTQGDMLCDLKFEVIDKGDGIRLDFRRED